MTLKTNYKNECETYQNYILMLKNRFHILETGCTRYYMAVLYNPMGSKKKKGRKFANVASVSRQTGIWRLLPSLQVQLKISLMRVHF